MRSLRVVMLAAGLVAASFVPAMAAPESVQTESVVSASEAAAALKANMPQGVTLGGATSEQLIAAFEKTAKQNPSLAAELAALVAAARPDMVEGLRQSINSNFPETAQAIIEKMDQAASNPSADQLAAIAQSEGSAPAAGPDDGGDADGSAQ